MKIKFTAALGSKNPAYANEPLSGAFCVWNTHVALPITCHETR